MIPRKFASAVIAKLRQGWTQHRSAENAQGRIARGSSTEAVRWCLVGACYAVDQVNPPVAAYQALTTLEAKVGGVAQWNDRGGRTVEEVIALVESCTEPQ